MIDPTEKKFEIENKLEKELNNLNLLKERAQKSSQLTKGMVGILSSFEHRLARLEETILPVYNETGNLQRRQENIEQTIAALDHVVEFYGVSQEVEPIVRAGPTPDLLAFLQALVKLQAALQYFEKNNPQSVELENVSTLYNSGGDSLNRLFKETLFKHSAIIPPVTLLDSLANDDEPDCRECVPEEIANDLAVIADWLMVNNRDEYMNVYARVRAVVLQKTLHRLKDHQKTASGGSMQNMGVTLQGPTSSPMPRAKFGNRYESSNRRGSRRLQHVFEKKANKMLLKASQTLEQSTGLSLGARRMVPAEHKEDSVDEQEMENYLECVMVVQRLMMLERRLMNNIVPVQHQHQIFQIVIKDAMDECVTDGENIASRARRCIMRHDFAAVLGVFPILKHLHSMKPDFDKTVEGCDVQVRSKFSRILNTLHSTGAKALEAFIESVRNDPSSQLPRDGTVHELTSNVLVFLEQLLEYVDTIGEVLTQENDKNINNNTLLGIYIKKVLAQLNLTLLTKSDLYSDIYLRAVFRLNNNNYVLKAIQRSGLLDFVTLTEPGCEEAYYDMILEHKKAYSNSWSKVLGNIWSPEDTGPIQLVYQGKLRDKERNLIKECFAGFNKEMEDIARVQRGYSIPDVELRESLKRDNKEFVLPKYNAFYDKYSNVPFTKNVDKYIRHTPAQVGAMIDRFFDVAA